ncbi:MAG: Hsp20/alpha crystallin family protein [Bacteroidaceae bacterium]|nr:Hsp20/alpha crystallin family protein [Bacteroidaceae bacterium]
MLMKRGGQTWIPSIFNDFFNNDILVRNSSTVPAINVIEREKEYKVEVAAAGMRKEDFKIHIDSDNDLTITMEKNCNCETKNGKECCCEDDKKNMEECKDSKCDTDKCEDKGRYLRREFSYTRFQQTLILPDDADTEKIEAKVKHGVLKIHIPKKAKTGENKIDRIIAIE